MRRASVLLCCFLIVSAASGQTRGGARIAGQVTHAESGSGLPDVHVFISGSTAGTTSNAEGRFTLEGIPLGANRIVISRVGYSRQAHDVVVRRPILFSMDFALQPQIVDLEEIVVTGELDPNWERHLTAFGRGFLGMTGRAEAAQIMNSEVLSFQVEDGVFTARADAPLVVENRALGYRILYFLRTYESSGDETRQEGEALFGEMTPDSAEQQERWALARKAAFDGSSRHLFRQLFHGQTKDAGFFLYSASRPRPPRQAAASQRNQAAPSPTPQFALRPEELTADGPSARERYLSFTRYIEVVYTKELQTRAYRAWQGLPEPVRADYQRSWITLTNDSVLMDSDGGILDAYGVVYHGHMAFERLADLVPKEYVPPGSSTLEQRTR